MWYIDDLQHERHFRASTIVPCKVCLVTVCGFTFGLDSDCVRCIECRKQQQGIAREREIYESFDKMVEQSLEVADACLSLIESGVFTTKQTQRVRMLLNAVPDDADVRKRSRYANLIKRVLAAEEGSAS
jgi:hypothetical protein